MHVECICEGPGSPPTRGEESEPSARSATSFDRPSLRDVQQDFAAAVFENTTTALAHLRDGTFAAERHLQVYRNNTFANLTEALGAIYPVVKRLVGEEFFGFAADRYIRRHPPLSGNLHDFGCEFAAFLTTFEAAASLAYLSDVATLDWAWHEAFHAADAAPLDLASLRAVPPDGYDALIFALHPSARLIVSPYPILRIWEVNQPEHEGDQSVDLDQGGDRLLIVRRGLRVEIQSIDAGDHALLTAFAERKPLALANEQAVDADAHFDLMQALQRHIQSGTVVGFA